MPDYKKMYSVLFHKITAVIAALQEFQQQTEEMYINSPPASCTLAPLSKNVEKKLRFGLQEGKRNRPPAFGAHSQRCYERLGIGFLKSAAPQNNWKYPPFRCIINCLAGKTAGLRQRLSAYAAIAFPICPGRQRRKRGI